MTADEVFARFPLSDVVDASVGATECASGHVPYRGSVFLCFRSQYSVRLGVMPYEEAQRLAREINDLIAVHKKMKGG